MSSASDEDISCTPDSMKMEAEAAINNILPESSKERYLKTYDEFMKWRKEKQAQSARACRCAAAARALSAESLALRYLDDVVALLRGEVSAVSRAKAWPFAISRREPNRNYIV